MRIGLFGGSFNPPHEGHRLVSQQVMKRIGLHAVWWLVTPGNPLKDNDGLPPVEDRITAARQLITHPRVHATGFEAAHGFTYTHATLEFLTSALPDRRFVWIMGADSLVNFHNWDRWREVARMVPIAVYARPGSTRLAPSSVAASTFARFRLDESDAELLPDCTPPAWVYLSGLMSGLSSTELRATRRTGSPE
jgi:nicotinate-nucleotide adenylyltransferase